MNRDRPEEIPPGVPRASEVTGAVLCGGASRRMGRDKAVVPIGGRPLIERAVAAVGAVAERVVLASGSPPRYPALGLEEVADEIEGAGPLAGLVAALEAAGTARTEWVAVSACDLPRVEGRLFARLLQRGSERDLDACLYAGPSGREPLIAVYRTRCLAAARAALVSGRRRADSFLEAPGLRTGVLAATELEELEPDLAARALSLNLNTPAELAAEQAVRGGLAR